MGLLLFCAMALAEDVVAYNDRFVTLQTEAAEEMARAQAALAAAETTEAFLRGERTLAEHYLERARGLGPFEGDAGLSDAIVASGTAAVELFGPRMESFVAKRLAADDPEARRALDVERAGFLDRASKVAADLLAAQAAFAERHHPPHVVAEHHAPAGRGRGARFRLPRRGSAGPRRRVGHGGGRGGGLRQRVHEAGSRDHPGDQ